MRFFCLDMSPGTMTKYVSKATSGLFRKINGEVSKICFSALQCLLIRKFVHVFGREATSPSVCSSVLPKLWLADKEPIAPRITCLKTAFRIHPDPLHFAGSESTSILAPDPDPLRFLFPDPDPLKALILIQVAPKQTQTIK